jgi:hypothetical protein
MAEKLEELFVLEVGVGIANMDASTDDGVVSTKVVVQEVTATDRESDEPRRLMLIYGAENVATVADQLRAAAERAMAEQT